MDELNTDDAVTFTVYVDENGHFGDEDERWPNGVFTTYEEALAKCQNIVRDNLEEAMRQGSTAQEAHGQWSMFGEDPWIDRTPEGFTRFSARVYAAQLAEELAADAAV